jgi:hypothetical protein
LDLARQNETAETDGQGAVFPAVLNGTLSTFDAGEIKKLTDSDLKRIESKLDLIIDAMGLSDNHRLAPAEVNHIAKNIVLQFKKKNANDTKNERKTG